MIVFAPLGLDKTRRHNSKVQLCLLFLPMPSSASHPTMLLSLSLLILLMFLLSFSRLTLSSSVSFFSYTEVGSPPTFRINLLLLLQILLQALLIRAALYSRMQYLSCIYAVIFSSMLSSKQAGIGGSMTSQPFPPPPPTPHPHPLIKMQMT